MGYLTKNLGVANATCEICNAGSYNSQLDATTCSKCGAGYKSSTPGAVSSEQCTQCGVDTYSAAGAAQGVQPLAPATRTGPHSWTRNFTRANVAVDVSQGGASSVELLA
jgi:hypothetical protein